ncbi:hypothetical protein GE21DRAFT_3742 [Neurospora crassa]|uniref:Uncharacterized protein n=2 Tax=Neurospora crassa TaxID=5141 RepID=Q7SC09_NEUCR|nr:hypothetical protein NCU09472 [Neurospora crassa OR74A]EAA33991.1 hypothetical protein NCU09472 [Neurospora crassa OR74A]KHE83355.1 hypothetical protein GE21DRAFT_3742 [Neurospora crassa]CAE75720.1 related to interaptin (abpD) [Neurospora crassa]|eukprot:XP_963227.1 hypothetical protein NCU09472 [Neurospora crassa OR74A]
MSFTLPRFKLGKSARKKTDRDGNGSGSHDGKHHSIDVLLRHDLKQLSKLRAEQLEGYSKEDLESLPLDRRQVLPAEVLSTLNPRALNQLPGKTIAKLSTAAQITLSPWALARIPISTLATIDSDVLFCALPVLGSDDLRVLKKAIHQIGHDKLRQLPPDVIRRLPFELPSEPLQLPLQWRESSMISPEKSLPPDPPRTSTHSLGVPSENLYSDARHDRPSYEQPSVVPPNAHYNPANVDTSIFSSSADRSYTSPPSPAHTVPGRSSPNTVRSSATVQATAYPPRASDHRLSYAPRRNSSVSRGSHIRARSSSRGPRPDRNQEYQAYTPGSVKFAELGPIEFADLSRDASELGPSTPPPRSSSRLENLSVSEHIKRAESWNDKSQEFPRTEAPRVSREIIPKEDSRSMSPTSTSTSSSPDVASSAKRKLRAAQGNTSSSANDDADSNYKHQVIQDHTISELKAENKRLNDQLIDVKADHKALLNRLTKYLDDKDHSKRHTGDPIGVVITYCEELCKERKKIAKENKDREDDYLREKMHRQEVEDLVDEKSRQLRVAEDDLRGLQSKVKEYSRRATELEARESSLRNNLSRLERENKELHKRCENQKVLSEAAIKRVQRENEDNVAQLRQIAADHVSQMRAQKEEYAQKMQDQRMYYEGQVKSLHQQLAGQSQSHETQLAQATEDLQDTIDNLRSQHTEELSRMESAFSEQIAALQTAHSQQIAAQQKKHEQDIQRLNKKHARNVVDLREKVQSLENDLVGNNDDFRPATDDSLKIQYRQLKLCIDMVTEPINLGISGVPRNLGKLDPTRFLEREGKNQLRFLLRSVVWQKIVEGFFSEPFGFGALGKGEGREVLRGVVEGWRGLCGYDDGSLSNGKMDTELLTPFFHSREANKWRSATFQSILMTVAPPSSSMSGSKSSSRKGQQAGAPSPRGTPGPPEHPIATPYYTNINQVQSQIVALLSSICSEPLSSEVQSKVSELARQAGELALQFGAQRAQLGLEVPKRGEQVKIGTESGWVDCEDGDSFGGRRGVEVEVDLCVSPKVYRVGDMDGRNMGDKKGAKVKAIVAGEVYPRRS